MEFEEFDIEFLAQKIADNPQSPLFARLADLYVGKEQTVEAIKLAEEGIKQYPNYYAGYLVLGKAHLALKEYSNATRAFEKALELSPFNQTAVKLIHSVPNSSDQSTRTTEENYFVAEPLLAEDHGEIIPEPIVQEEFSPSTDLENSFSMNSEEISVSSTDQPVMQSPTAQVNTVESYDQPVSSGPFPSFDEYFAENQHRITGGAEKKLDDYLSESSSGQNVTVSRDIDPSIFTNTNFETTAIEPEVRQEPEAVFSSPEQAQLFAEMAGEEYPNTGDEYRKSDLDALTEKLQSAEKIIPQENYQSKTPIPEPAQEDQVYETDAVTPTLAEIYASQGEFRAAIQAYEILMFSQPAKGGDYQKRIRELQQLQMEKDGLI